MREVLRAPFKSGVSVSPSPVGLLKLRPMGLQSEVLWGLIFLVQNPQAGETDGGLRALTPVGEPLQSSYFPVCGSPQDPGSVTLDDVPSLPLLPLLVVVPSLVSLVVEDLCWWVPACSSVVVLQTVVILGVFVRGGELRL